MRQAAVFVRNADTLSDIPASDLVPTSLNSTLAAFVIVCSYAGAKSLLNLPMLIVGTHARVVLFLEPLPWPFSVPLFEHRWKP